MSVHATDGGTPTMTMIIIVMMIIFLEFYQMSSLMMDVVELIAAAEKRHEGVTISLKNVTKLDEDKFRFVHH